MADPKKEHALRCGDAVLLSNSETVVVAYADYEQNRLSWAGWPYGTVKISEVKLVAAVDDAAHESAVEMWASSAARDASGFDDRRTTVLRLYKPTAYHTELLAILRSRAEEYRNSLAACNDAIVASEQALAALSAGGS